MTIQIDSREKARAIRQIVADFDRMNVTHFVSKLPVADYMNLDNPRLVIDRKQNLAEVAVNLSDVPKKDKDGRFKRDIQGKPLSEWNRINRELQRAHELGIQMIFLVEHGHDVRCLSDVRKWVNPRLKEHPLTMSGERLYRRMDVLERKYGVRWEFCEKKNTARRIVELLGGVDQSRDTATTAL